MSDVTIQLNTPYECLQDLVSLLTEGLYKREYNIMLYSQNLNVNNVKLSVSLDVYLWLLEVKNKYKLKWII